MVALVSDFYNGTQQAAGTGPVAPQSPAVGPGISGNFSVGAGLSTAGFPTVLGGLAVLAIGFWLLHQG